MSVYIRKPYDESERKSIAYYVLRAQLDNGDWIVFDDEGKHLFIIDDEQLWKEDDWVMIT